MQDLICSVLISSFCWVFFLFRPATNTADSYQEPDSSAVVTSAAEAEPD